MKEAQYQALLTAVEQNVFKYDHEYVNAVIALLKEHEATLSEKQTAQLKNEVAAFIIGTLDTTQNRKEPRLRPDNGFTDEQLTYYLSRSKKSTNPVMRQRYLDILWEKGKKLTKREIGEQLIASSLEVATLLEHENEFEKQNCLNRALQIAVLIEKTPAKLTKQATAAIIAYLENLEATNNFRFTLELIDTVLGFNNLFTKANYELCFRISEKAVKHYTTDNDNFTLRGAFIERLHKLKKLIDPKSYSPKGLAEELAQVQIDEAHRRDDSIMVQQHFLVEAEKILKDAGLKDQARTVRLEVEQLAKSEGYDKQFQSFTFETVIPQKEIDKVLELLKKYPDTAALIAISPNFITKWSEQKEYADKAPASITDLVTQSTINEDGMTVAVGGDSERTKVMRYYQPQIEFKLSLLANLLQKLVDEKAITAKNFELQFKKIEAIDKDCWESVKHGLKLYLEGDYYAASLILTTQLENFIFRLLPVMGIEQYFFESDGRTQSPKTLGKFLPEIKGVVSEDVYELLNYTLIDKANLNLRNKVGHGKTNINSGNNLTCVRLLQLFSCLLVNVNISKK